MKRAGVVAIAVLCLGGALARGQPVPGKRFELGTAVSFYHLRYHLGEVSDYYSMLNVPVRFGWFVWKGLEIEPEITMIIPLKGGDGLAHYFEAKLVYHFKPSGKLIPFLGFTTGWGNGLPKRGWHLGGGKVRTMADGVIGGLKLLVGKNVALRAEYRLVLYAWREDDGLYREAGTLHHGFVGASVFF